jgi:hypothetical protein
MKKIAYGLGLLFAFYYLLVMQIMASWGFNVDDMYITLRYAKHLVSGQGIVWNQGGAVIEGYSNFSYLLLSAAAIKLNLDPVVVLKITGVVFLILSLVFLYLLMRLWVEPIYAVIPTMWLLAYKGQIIWSVSGLETVTFQALIVAALFFLFRGIGYEFYDKQSYTKINVVYFIVTALLLSLAGLTRPDALVFIAVWFIGLLWILFYSERKLYGINKIRALVLYCLIICCVYGSYFLWRWYYFGAFLPNPFYCKWLTGESIGVLDYEYIKLVLPLLAAGLPYLLGVKDKRKLFLILPSIAYLLLLYDSHISVGYFNRHFLACFALLLPLPLLGMRATVNYFNIMPLLSKVLIYVASVYFALFFIPMLSLDEFKNYIEKMEVGNLKRLQLAQYLGNELGPKSKIVLGDCGVPGYYSDLFIIDSYCLNSKMMTSDRINNSHQKFVNWILNEEKPAAIVLISYLRDGKLYHPIVDKIFISDKQFKQNYHLKRSFEITPIEGKYEYAVYFRKKPGLDDAKRQH